MDKAIKYDHDKAKLSLIPYEALKQEAFALAYGAEKYGKNNYKKGMEWSRLIDATLRHIHSFNNGEDVDKESLICHLGHAKANLSILIFYIENNLGVDDRNG